MQDTDLKERTKAFALRVLKLVDSLPSTISGHALGKQLVRSATSVAANYRAARRAKSTAHFISKLGDVEEEADETLFWLEMLADAKLFPLARLIPLIQEANELVAIIVVAIKTTKRHRAS